jgi:allantoicase
VTSPTPSSSAAEPAPPGASIPEPATRDDGPASDGASASRARDAAHDLGAHEPRPDATSVADDGLAPAGPAFADQSQPGFRSAMDLAARRLGGMVLWANDEFFGPKEALLDPAAPVYDVDAYYDRGKVMDGWETRRRRTEGHDTAVVRLGIAGIVEALVVDTTHFRGNAPAACFLEGAVTDGAAPDASTTWFPLLDTTAIRPHERQVLHVGATTRVTHVRFGIVPDGGVARLRVLGCPLVDLHAVADPHGRLDLAAAINGGRAIGCSDEFFSSPHNLIMVGDSRDMADGWETRRRRGPGEDWAVLELAATGHIDRLELDTTHFKGNHPHRVVIDGVHAPGAGLADIDDRAWTTLVEPSPTEPHARHLFSVDATDPVSHLRLRVQPDGGVARLRAFGTIDDDGWRRHGVTMLDAASTATAHAHLLDCCGSQRFVEGMLARRPFGSLDALLRAAEEVWSGVGPQDHLEAFGAHPRIGERSASAASQREQAGVDAAEQQVLDALAAGNRAYEERFGHVFLIRAAGRDARQMLDALEERLTNDADTERRIAAEQQGEITRLRLEHLVRHGVSH